MARLTTIGFALALAGTLSVCGATEIPLIGPCSASKRIAPDKVYSDLALTMTVRKAWSFDGGRPQILSEDDRSARLAELDELRRNWLPTIADACLRAHASDWLDVTERNFRSQRIGSDGGSDYDRREAEKADQKRALAERLGVRP